MFDTPRDYLAKRAQDLDIGRADALGCIQALLDGLYPGLARAVSLHEEALKIVTPSAAVASELRLRQVQLLKDVRALIPSRHIDRLLIQIRA